MRNTLTGVNRRSLRRQTSFSFLLQGDVHTSLLLSRTNRQLSENIELLVSLSMHFTKFIFYKYNLFLGFVNRFLLPNLDDITIISKNFTYIP